MKIIRLAVAVFAAVLSIPAHAARVSVWIAPWDADSLTSLQANAANIDESNPVWYSMSSSGGIVTNWNAENEAWRAAMSGTEILPTVQNIVNGSYDPAVVAQLLGTEQSRAAHAEELTRLAVNKAYHGLDIDYEAIPASSRAQFTSFIQLLGQKLHGVGKKLSVTVHAKTSDAQNWDGPGAQDWIAIGAAADSVKIMAYDYHWATSEAGPLTPLAWLDAVAAYAESAIPAEKISMALPWYGYDWRGKAADTVSYASAMELARSTNAIVSHDVNGEATFRYSDRQVFFQDAESYARKLEVLRQKHPSINAIAHWRGGDEDPAIWNVIRDLETESGGSGGSVLPHDFVVTGDAALSVNAGKTIQSTYAISGVNGFQGAVGVTLTANGFPGTITLSTDEVMPGNALQLKVSASRRASDGVHGVVLRFTAGSLVKEQLVRITINNSRR